MPSGHGGADEALDFLEAQDLGAVHELHAFFGHAVEAADVAAVGYADAQVIVDTAETVDERWYGTSLDCQHALDGHQRAGDQVVRQFDARLQSHAAHRAVFPAC